MAVSGLGQLTEEYSLTSDFDDQWLTGGTEDDVIKEAKLDESSILEAVSKFANDYDDRMKKTEQFNLNYPVEHRNYKKKITYIDFMTRL